jgi:hypothetical protein
LPVCVTRRANCGIFFAAGFCVLAGLSFIFDILPSFDCREVLPNACCYCLDGTTP